MKHAIDHIAPKNIHGRFAAKDVLVVSKSGPTMPLLTLVDLPGLVKVVNVEQSQEDIDGIESLTDRYMKSPRTIILAVVGGNQDYVQATILEKARKFDPTGGRTIGVLTKPDMTKSNGLEDKFIGIIKNSDKKNEFKLGWYVLKNPWTSRKWPGMAIGRPAEARRGRVLHDGQMERTTTNNVWRRCVKAEAQCAVTAPCRKTSENSSKGNSKGSQ